MSGLGRHLLKARKGERMQRDHHSRARLGEIQANKRVLQFNLEVTSRLAAHMGCLQQGFRLA